ncbi:MAG: YigZ family protein [Gammaproteobacteria bacterium]|nr:MAG: YigZ family protein [Gammaproteobacteria bacterium]
MTSTSQNYVVVTSAQAEYEIKKSLFIGVILPCSNEREALQQLHVIANQHPNANHLAFAWRIRQEDGFIAERCNDAGEPSGTAGRPILAPLEGGSIINAVIGVIRYFGGVKLGTGGLARAYGTAAKLAIESAGLKPWVEMSKLKLTIDYSQLQLLEYQLNKCNGQIIDQQFTDRVAVVISLPVSEKEQIQQQFLEY